MRLLPKTLCICAIAFLRCTTLAGQVEEHEYTLLVRDSATLEVLDEVLVYNDEFLLETGDSVLTIDRALLRRYDSLMISRVGYRQIVLRTAELLAFGRLEILLSAVPQQEVVVVGKPEQVRASRRVDQQTFDDLVFIGGEKDLIRTLSSLPSVEEGKDGLANYHVRGSGHEQNEILVDGTPLLMKTSDFELFSSVPSSMIQRIDFYPGIFPSNYGGRIASFADLSTWTEVDSAAIDLLLSPLLPSLDVKVPVAKGKVGLMGSVRTVPLLLLDRTGSVEETLHSNYAGYHSGTLMHSALAKCFLKSQRVYVGATLLSYGFHNEFADNFQYTYSREKNQNRSMLGSLQIEYELVDGLWIEGTAGWSSVNTAYERENREEYVEESYQDIAISRTSLDIGLWKGETSVRWKASDRLEYVAGIEHRKYSRGVYRRSAILNDERLTSELERIVDSETRSLYGVAQYRAGRWDAKGGARIDHYVASAFRQRAVLPYVEVSWHGGRWSHHLGVNTSRQYEHEFIAFGDFITWNLYRSSDEDLRPEQARIYSIGSTYKGQDGEWSVDAEVYFKSMEEQVLYIAPPIDLTLSSLGRTTWSGGKGKAYGLEMQVHKRWNATSTTGATLNVSTARQRFDGLNGGRWFNYKFNRRFSISLNHVQGLSSRLTLKIAGYYRGGYYVTFPVGFTPSAVSPFTYAIYKDINNYRLPPYHRVDLSLERSFPRRSKRHKMSLSIHNVYARRNPVNVQPYIQIREGSEPVVVLSKRKSFSIFPSLNVSLKIL